VHLLVCYLNKIQNAQYKDKESSLSLCTPFVQIYRPVVLCHWTMAEARSCWFLDAEASLGS